MSPSRVKWCLSPFKHSCHTLHSPQNTTAVGNESLSYPRLPCVSSLVQLLLLQVCRSPPSQQQPASSPGQDGNEHVRTKKEARVVPSRGASSAERCLSSASVTSDWTTGLHKASNETAFKHLTKLMHTRLT